MSFGETLVVAILTALATASLTLWVERKKENNRYLLERYSELVGIAIDELERVKSMSAALAIGSDDAYNSVLELHLKRHGLRAGLQRVALQIRLCETDQSLAKKASQLANAQPTLFLGIRPRIGNESDDRRAEQFNKDIISFENCINELIDSVLQVHSAEP